MENFQYLYRKMDGILAVSLEIQERDMQKLKKEIELWRLASTSRTFISDLFKRPDCATLLLYLDVSSLVKELIDVCNSGHHDCPC
jgi:hypothetical protein